MVHIICALAVVAGVESVVPVLNRLHFLNHLLVGLQLSVGDRLRQLLQVLTHFLPLNVFNVIDLINGHMYRSALEMLQVRLT